MGRLLALVVVLVAIAMAVSTAFSFLGWFMQEVQEGRLAEMALNFVIRQLWLWAFMVLVVLAVWVAVWVSGQKRKP